MLSRREREVLGLLAEGLTYHQVAKHLFIAKATVKSHVAHILWKLRAANIAHAVAIGCRTGLLDRGYTVTLNGTTNAGISA